MESAESLLARQRALACLRGVELNNPESLRATLAEELHSSVDGRGLEQSDLVPSQHQWVAGAMGLLRYTGMPTDSCFKDLQTR